MKKIILILVILVILIITAGGYYIATNTNKTKIICTPNWQCGDWSVCSNLQQLRVCTDLNNCGITAEILNQTQTCTVTPPTPSQQELTQQLIQLLTQMIKQLQQELTQMLAQQH